MRRWMQRTHLAGFVALTITACARGEHVPVRGGIAVPADAGRRVTLAAPARRVVSLLPSFTEMLFAIGAGDRLVGRTTWCDYPPQALAVPSVGDGMPPSVEAVAARHPDLVVLYRSGPNVAAAEQLERLRLRTVLFALNPLPAAGPGTQGPRPPPGGPGPAPRRRSASCGGVSRRCREVRVARSRAPRDARGGPAPRARERAPRRPVGLAHPLAAPVAARGARFSRGRRPGGLGRRPPGAGQESARRPVPPRALGWRRVGRGRRDRAPSPGSLGPATCRVRRSGGGDGAGVSPRAHWWSGARPADSAPGGRGRGGIRRGGHDGHRLARRSPRAAQRGLLAGGRGSWGGAGDRA